MGILRNPHSYLTFKEKGLPILKKNRCQSVKRHRIKKLQNTAYLLPLFALIVVFNVYPVMQMIWGSFYKIKMNGTEIFVNLENYQKILSQDYMLQVLGNTVLWVVVTVILKNLIGLGLALVLNKEFKFKKVFMIFAVLPWATPWIIDSITFRWIFDGLYGYINSLLFSLNLIQQPIDFLGNEAFAIWAVICCNVWSAIPFVGFTYLAKLYSIPQHLYEATSIDGAGKIKQFRYITLPLLMPTVKLMSLLTTLWGLNSFDMIYTMTGGGPIYASETIVTQIYRQGFVFADTGVANALSVLSFFVMFAFTLVYVRNNNRGEQLD